MSGLDAVTLCRDSSSIAKAHRMPNIGPTELIIVLVIVLLIFGPKRLPGLGRQLGSGMREFKESITGGSRADDEEGGERDAFGRRRLDAGDEADRAEAGARSATTEPEVVGGEAEHRDRPAARGDA
jgi:sec-independent protein translocase protein TatA